jgi:signal peptidase I
LYWFYIVLAGILLAIVLRVFFFAAYVIPTSSMNPAIIPGDKVIVNKLIPGPRIIRNFFSLHKGEKPDITRLKGIRAIRRNDVLIFNFPYSDWNRLKMDMNVYYAKRCVAIPGDTFYIENGIYKVKNGPDVLGNYDAQHHFSEVKKGDIRLDIFHCFPNNEDYHWTVKLFGPLYIPRRGDTLAVDSKNIALYRNLIRYETDKEIYRKNDSIYLENDCLQLYVFQQNYYFMAGDQVPDSRDSRYWGLLPEDHIVGKVAFVLYSKDRKTGKYRWERFFRTKSLELRTKSCAKRSKQASANS